MNSTNSALTKALKGIFESAGLEYREEEDGLIRAAGLASSVAAAEITSAIFSARVNEQSLRLHADALRAAAQGSNRYAENLGRTTWRWLG